MNFQYWFRLALRYLPGGPVARIGLGLFIMTLYLYALAFMFMTAVFLAAIGSLYLSARVSWISAESFRSTISRLLGFSGHGPSVGLYAGGALIFLLYCDFLLLFGGLATPYLGEGAPAWESGRAILPSAWLLQPLSWLFGLDPYGAGVILLAIFAKVMILPAVLLYRQRHENSAGGAEPSLWSYLEPQALDNLRFAPSECWRQIVNFIMSAYGWIVTAFFRGRKAWFLWPLGLAGILTLILPLALSAAFLSAISLFYAGTAVLLRVLAPAWARIRSRATGTRLP